MASRILSVLPLVVAVFLLLSGISAVSWLIGYFVGISEPGSASPFVTTLTTMVTTALALFAAYTATNRGLMAYFHTKGAGNGTDKPVNAVVLGSNGVALVLFVCFFYSGFSGGTQERIQRKFTAPTAFREKNLVWDDNNVPPTTTQAVSWIQVHDILQTAGYSDVSIKKLYALRVAEWKKANLPNATADEKTLADKKIDAELVLKLKEK